MRFSTFLLSGMAAMAMAAPLVVTRTATAVVTVTVPAPPVQPDRNLVAVTITSVVTATAPAMSAANQVASAPVQVITVLPAPSSQASSFFWSEIGGGTAPAKSSVEYTSSSFPHVVPDLTFPSTSEDSSAYPTFSNSYVSKLVAAPTPSSYSPGPSNADDSDLGFDENNMAHECQTYFQDDLHIKLCTDSLIAHNRHRKNHTVPAIHWDTGLFLSASAVAATCKESRDVNGGGYGQNLQIGTPIDNIQAAITNSWYNSEVELFPDSDYGQPTPLSMNNNGLWERYGHFTQLIWAASTKVGCAVQSCDQLKCNPNNGGCPSSGFMGSNYGHSLTVCNYLAPGNFKGYFAGNVTRAQPGTLDYGTYTVKE